MAKDAIEDIETLAKSLGEEVDFKLDLPVSQLDCQLDFELDSILSIADLPKRLEALNQYLIKITGKLEPPPETMDEVGAAFGKSSTTAKAWVLSITSELRLQPRFCYYTSGSKMTGITRLCWLIFRDYGEFNQKNGKKADKKLWLKNAEIKFALYLEVIDAIITAEEEIASQGSKNATEVDVEIVDDFAAIVRRETEALSAPVHIEQAIVLNLFGGDVANVLGQYVYAAGYAQGTQLSQQHQQGLSAGLQAGNQAALVGLLQQLTGQQ